MSCGSARRQVSGSRVTASKPLHYCDVVVYVYSVKFVRVCYRFLHYWDRLNLVWKESRGAENYVVHYHYNIRGLSVNVNKRRIR